MQQSVLGCVAEGLKAAYLRVAIKEFLDDINLKHSVLAYINI